MFTSEAIFTKNARTKLRNVHVQCIRVRGGGEVGFPKRTKYVENWPSTTSAWAGWRRFDIPVDRSALYQLNSGVFYLLVG
jgi:hypothetical protein